jgi:CheY-like chemotaxis protein
VHAADAFSVNDGLMVLVADDNPSYLKMASDVIEQCGISALLVSDGAEAVHLACERRFDIILMDLQMPGMDGLKATSRIRQFEDTCSRPRTPMVAYSTSEVSKTLLTASGMDDRLSEPCSAKELEVCLLRW